MSKQGMRLLRLAFVFVTCLSLAGMSWAAHVNTHALNSGKSKSQKINEGPRTRRRLHRLARSRSARVTRTSMHTRRHRYYERFSMSSFASGISEGDITAGEDPIVRQAAIDALGNMNGTVVAIQPTSGRVLAMVNQKLALSSGGQPCSTIKLSVALAALSEGLVSKETQVALSRRSRMNLTMALAHSNNAYFEGWDLRKSRITRMNMVWANWRVTILLANNRAPIPRKSCRKSSAVWVRCVRLAKASR
jgi:membrane carboxypeptidase/penicillin-binding protein